MTPKYCGEEFICLITGNNGADIHHIKTQKSHPELKDVKENMMPLSHFHHVECHAIGMSNFAKKYPRVRKWLVANGWTLDPVTFKWENYDLR